MVDLMIAQLHPRMAFGLPDLFTRVKRRSLEMLPQTIGNGECIAARGALGWRLKGCRAADGCKSICIKFVMAA